MDGVMEMEKEMEKEMEMEMEMVLEPLGDGDGLMEMD